MGPRKVKKEVSFRGRRLLLHISKAVVAFAAACREIQDTRAQIRLCKKGALRRWQSNFQEALGETVSF